jgi:hypothetical protein
MSRAAYAAALDAKQKLQEIAAKTYGGKTGAIPSLRTNAVFHKAGGREYDVRHRPAQHAIKLGGIYDGHEAPPK